MKTGILKTGAGVAVEVRCPDCGEALCANQCEDRIFWTDEVNEGDTGYCPKCQMTHLLPDLSMLKVVDAGLFQEILVTLRAFVYCNTAKAGECIHCPLKDECEPRHGLMKIGQAVIDKAKKA